VDAELRRKTAKDLGPIYCAEDYICSDPDVRQYRTDGKTGSVACILSNPARCSLAVARAGGPECRCVLRATLLEKLS
jgi:hypothetical protein